MKSITAIAAMTALVSTAAVASPRLMMAEVAVDPSVAGEIASIPVSIAAAPATNSLTVYGSGTDLTLVQPQIVVGSLRLYTTNSVAPAPDAPGPVIPFSELAAPSTTDAAAVVTVAGTVTTPNAVPEPGIVALLGLGIVGCAVLRRSRRG